MALTVAKYDGILIVADQAECDVTTATLELLSEGRKLADKLHTRLDIVVFGLERSKQYQLHTYGADCVYNFAEEIFNDRCESQYIDALAAFLTKSNPEIVLFIATYFFKSISAGVASKLGTGLTADCTGLDVDFSERLLYQTRPAFGGNLLATVVCPDKRPQMATVRPHIFPIAEPDSKREGKTEDIKTAFWRKPQVHLMERMVRTQGEDELDKYQTLISIGRGVDYKKCIGGIEELAALLKAGICCSRAVVDAGFLPRHQQIGLTGSAVKCRIYIALGISGALQHLVGIRAVETVIAINQDPQAPIFGIAGYGMVSEIEKALPCLIQEVKQYKLINNYKK